MTASVLACTHFAAFLLGALVCYRFVLRYGKPLVENPTRETLMEDDSSNTPTKKTDRPRSTRLIIMSLVASVAVIAIGVDAHISQVHSDRADKATRAVVASNAASVKQSNHQRDCTNLWAAQVKASLQAGRDANKALRNHDEYWHKRVDSIFQLLIRARANEDTTDAEVDHIVADYQQAKAELFKQYDAVKQTTVDHPYPVLNLHCKLPKGAG